jgi:hypothetical protein
MSICNVHCNHVPPARTQTRTRTLPRLPLPPGTRIAIKYQRGPDELTHSLVRACTSEQDDMRIMFELL